LTKRLQTPERIRRLQRKLYLKAKADAVGLGVKPVGEPDAGNPHVRFDERGRETGPPDGEQPRPSSTLPQFVWKGCMRLKVL
jgi:hypothetical protein